MTGLEASPSIDQSLKRLPTHYSHLSDGGEIIVEKPKGNMKVFFFTFRGMMSGSHGFLYAADGQPRMYTWSQITHVQKLAPHWYWLMVELGPEPAN